MKCSDCKKRPDVRREGDERGFGHWVIECCNASVNHPSLTTAIEIWEKIHGPKDDISSDKTQV